MNPDSTALNLRDIHLPSSIEWWPPAPGWWLLLGIILFILAITFLVYRMKQHRRIYNAALAEFNRIKTDYQQHTNDQQLVQALSILLRRVCMSFYPRKEVAALTGRAWLEFLDSQMAGTKQSLRFTEGAGQALISAPYQSTAVIDAEGLLSVCQSWLACLPRTNRIAS